MDATPYRLGFLLCDHALEHLAADFGDYPEMFASAFGEVSDAIDWRVFDVTAGEFPTDNESVDGYLISGSRHGAYDDLPWIGELSKCVRKLAAGKKPIVGLCFGHQILGQALGGRVEKSSKGWGLGLRSYQVEQSADWMTPSLKEFSIPVCHQDQITQLPPGAVRLASSEHCENFVVQFQTNVIGIQGHPEFATDFLSALVEWRRDVLPPDVHAQALSSLTRQGQNITVKQWIIQFLGIPPVNAT